MWEIVSPHIYNDTNTLGDLNLLILHVTYSGKTFNLVKPAIKHMQINRWETLKGFIMATGHLKSKVHCSQSDKKIAVILWTQFISTNTSLWALKTCKNLSQAETECIRAQFKNWVSKSNSWLAKLSE